MSAEQPTSYLPSHAALTAFLAQHPDLAVPPLRWSVIEDGSLYAALPAGSAGLPFLHRIAAAAGTEVTVGKPFHSTTHNGLCQIHRIGAIIHGFELTATVSVPTDEQQGGAE